jgi:predicted LPLAT superfamily acyltransferase
VRLEYGLVEIKGATIPSPNLRWTNLPERGTPLLLQFFHRIAVYLGRVPARVLLYPVTFYFFLAARTARRVSYRYLGRVLGRSVHWWNVFHLFHSFASTILDRVYLLRGEFGYFEVTLHGAEILPREMENGGILLGSHLGSFEVLRTLGLTRHFHLKVLMDIEHNENITSLLDALNPEVANTVIVPDRPDTLLRIKESLDAGFLVGTLGDRVTKNDKTVPCQFLGAPATFPAGPIIIASIMHCPVVLFFGLYRGGNRYEIFFEHFAGNILLDRARRPEELQKWVQRYVDRLEHYTRLAPDNWFNFYPFWD